MQSQSDLIIPQSVFFPLFFQLIAELLALSPQLGGKQALGVGEIAVTSGSNLLGPVAKCDAVVEGGMVHSHWPSLHWLAFPGARGIESTVAGLDDSASLPLPDAETNLIIYQEGKQIETKLK